MDTGCEEKPEGLRRPDTEINTPGLLSPINSSLLGILIIDHTGTIRLLKDAEFIGGWRQDVALVRLLEPAVKDSLERMNRVVDETVYALASAIERETPIPPATNSVWLGWPAPLPQRWGVLTTTG